jgi:AMP-polyphosphate phosphotransferase
MSKENLKNLQLKMLRIQQGIFHKGERMIVLFEGMDAAGKGGAIRKITANLDPRSIHVHPIGAPTSEEQGKHYLYRFWTKLPAPGMIAIFDRSWYGRVLVERVENLTEKKRWQAAFHEINQFEKLLTDDGIKIIKFYLKISKQEQLKRFEERLKDPYKQWKITPEDIRNRSHWSAYQKAHQDMILKTNTKNAPWHVIETDNKDEARSKVLELIVNQCNDFERWMEKNAQSIDIKKIKKDLSRLELKKIKN